MPLDATGFTIPSEPAPALTPFEIRWSPHKKGAVAMPRAIVPRSDAAALLHIWLMLETRWARKYRDGDNRCIVGWAAHTCEPTTICNYTAGQLQRVMERLHSALPKSAQRRWEGRDLTLARYNDTHSQAAVRAVVQRAYLAEVNARIEALNGQPEAPPPE